MPNQSEPIREALVIVGAGRVGGALATAAAAAGLEVELAGRNEVVDACANAHAALLCVPDDEIANACAAAVCANPRPAMVGHVSGAATLGVLAEAADAGCATFSVHPLQTFPDAGAQILGTPCAVAGSDAGALAYATTLAEALGMRPFTVPEQSRAAYHAAAAIASNLLVALEESAAGLLERAGVAEPRELLAPLVLRTATNWAERGPAALTGPIARGDEGTIERHRAAIAEIAPELLDLYEALGERARAIAATVPATGKPPDHVVGTEASESSPQVAGSGSGEHQRPMRTVTTIAALRDALGGSRGAGKRIGLVPTMGCFHEGHLALMRRARTECDLVVVSLFVNPTQFGPGEDLSSYPRDPERDAELARGVGVDVLWTAEAAEMYAPGHATTVALDERLTGVLCGDPGRRGTDHFRGVATIVAKLFNCVAPDVAYFGQKDAQQALVIRQIAADLNFPVEIELVATVREPDGLALSSRNSYLEPAERRRAAALHRALDAARERAGGGERSVTALVEAARAELARSGIDPEYLEARDAEDLSPVSELNGRPVLLALAAQVGRARLIDNIVIDQRKDH